MSRSLLDTVDESDNLTQLSFVNFQASRFVTSNPYKPPTKNSDAKPKWAVSSVVASVSAVAIWLALIAAVWIAYEPTFVDGEVRIEYEFRSTNDPFLFGYAESFMSIWLVSAIAILVLIPILFGCHYFARIYQRRHTRRHPAKF